MPNENLNLSLAHGLLRLGLGVNLFTHGCVRLPELAGFAAHVEGMVTRNWLPLWLLTAAGYAIPFVELTVGALLILGLFLRPALVLGSLLMIVLTLGICLAQNWTVAAEQLVYMLVFAVLLASVHYDRYSIDGWRNRAARNHSAFR